MNQKKPLALIVILLAACVIARGLVQVHAPCSPGRGLGAGPGPYVEGIDRPLATADKPTPAEGSERLQVMIGSAYEGHPHGHVALRVLGDDCSYVFEMGRYTERSFTGATGAAILRVWIGDQGFQLYKVHELETGRTTTSYTFLSSFGRNARVIDYYEKQIGGRGPRKTAHDGAMKEYELKNKFHVLQNNCVTIVVHAFQAGFPEVDLSLPEYNIGRNLRIWEHMLARLRGWPRTIWWTFDLKEELDKVYTQHPYFLEREVWREMEGPS